MNILSIFKFVKKILFLRKFKGLSKREVFSKIYQENIWGNGNSIMRFNSGLGSTDDFLVNLYVSNVKNYFSSTNLLSAVDYGCGDFRVGKNFCNIFSPYYAVDLVPELIEFNKEFYAKDNVEFLLLEEQLHIPKANVIIIRQVFQHMSNNDIKEVLDYILNNNFKFLILTEHIPNGENIKWNKDKINSSDIRLSQNSGVNVELFPFNLPFKEKTELCAVERNGGKIVTIIYKIS